MNFKKNIVCLLSLVLIACSSGNQKYTEKVINLGIVQDIDNCNTGKNSYRCDVFAIDRVFFDLDIKSFPGQQLKNGDKIYSVIRQYEYSSENILCRNKDCNLVSVCYLMPWCFNS